MYTKEQLENMEPAQLLAVANELDVKVSQDDELEKVVYAILDKAAEDMAANPSAKRKRTRITKKDTDRVYTVNGKEGENFDAKNNRVGKAVEAPSLFSDAPVVVESEEPAPEPVEAPAEEEQPKPKKRGRKSKAELAAIAAAAEAAKAQAEQEQAAEQPAAEEAPTETEIAPIPEETETAEPSQEDEAPQPEMLEQLQAKMANRVIDYPANPDGIWEGDPGDGTDFIPVVDLPIEDQAAIPTLDIFDRPVVQPQAEPIFQMQPTASTQRQSERYDFEDIITGNGVLEMLQDGYGFLRSSPTTSTCRPSRSSGMA